MNKRERENKETAKQKYKRLNIECTMGQQFDIMLMRITMHSLLRDERIPKLFLRNKVRAQSAQLIRGKYSQYSTRKTCCSCQFPSYLQCTWKIQYKLRAFTNTSPTQCNKNTLPKNWTIPPPRVCSVHNTQWHSLNTLWFTWTNHSCKQSVWWDANQSLIQIIINRHLEQESQTV